jgi:hypothetical protein
MGYAFLAPPSMGLTPIEPGPTPIEPEGAAHNIDLYVSHISQN